MLQFIRLPYDQSIMFQFAILSGAETNQESLQTKGNKKRFEGSLFQSLESDYV